jgi:ADP-ribosylglycohydrolase
MKAICGVSCGTRKGKNGDTDSIACLVGAMSGAYNGVGAIPDKWLTVESNQRLRDIGLRLFEVINQSDT